MSNIVQCYQSPDGGASITTATQYGLRYPDGTIIWSNIDLSSPRRQNIVAQDDANYIFDEPGVFRRKMRDINHRHTVWCEKQRVKCEPIVLVERRIILAMDEARIIETDN